MLAGVGFADATFHGWTGYVTSSRTQGGLVTARKASGELAPVEGGAGRAIGGHGTCPMTKLLPAPDVACYLTLPGMFLWTAGDGPVPQPDRRRGATWFVVRSAVIDHPNRSADRPGVCR